jgi:hypothetical protein
MTARQVMAGGAGADHSIVIDTGRGPAREGAGVVAHFALVVGAEMVTGFGVTGTASA